MWTFQCDLNEAMVRKGAKIRPAITRFNKYSSCSRPCSVHPGGKGRPRRPTLTILYTILTEKVPLLHTFHCKRNSFACFHDINKSLKKSCLYAIKLWQRQRKEVCRKIQKNVIVVKIYIPFANQIT